MLATVLGGGAQQVSNEQFGVRIVIDRPTQVATLYDNGKAVTTTWQEIWRPICGTPDGAMTRKNLRDNAARHELEMAAVDMASQDPPPGGAGEDGSHIIITFNNAASVPAAAVTALNDVKDYLESVFEDAINVKLNVSFQSLDPEVLGQTSAMYTPVAWTQSRNGLVNGMDGNDTLQSWLPTTSTIPVRYTGATATITNETRVFFTLANYRATIGSVSGTAGNMIFNSNFAWDYDPSNGVGGYSFQDVVIHEVGHALGFASGIDGRINDIESLDLFRFQRSDSGHDYNPETTTEFRQRPRLASFNSPNGEHICDLLGGNEYRMCDGLQHQASHFKNKEPAIGLMDPALGWGITFYPDFYSDPDLNLFDAIGYDR
jgi:hypothetical protein